MNQLESLAKLKDVLLSSIGDYRSICLLTHKNPDGDGLCCCLALQELIAHVAEKKAEIVLEEKAPQLFDFLDAASRTTIYHENLKYDLVIFVDCQSPSRLGSCAPLLDKAKRIIAVDHHESNPSEASIEALKIDAFLYNNPSYASVGAILFRALTDKFKALPEAAKTYAATNLYVTILNDTNKFINKNTDEEVFKVCSELIPLGADPYQTSRQFLSSHSPAYFRFVGQTLATITTHLDDKVLFFHSSLKMLADNKLNQDATTKMTDNVKGLPGNIKVTVYFRELKEKLYRLSLRSVDVNVNKIAVLFGGGGHITASGCEIVGELDQIQNEILKLIKKEL